MISHWQFAVIISITENIKFLVVFSCYYYPFRSSNRISNRSLTVAQAKSFFWVFVLVVVHFNLSWKQKINSAMRPISESVGT